jgi:selenocysteine lyase/cysteine desulfurase
MASRLYVGLRNIKRVKLFTRCPRKGKAMPVISFQLEGVDSEEATLVLSDLGYAVRGGLHCAPLAHKKMNTLQDGAVRVSIGCFNTRAQVDRLLAAVNKIR